MIKPSNISMLPTDPLRDLKKRFCQTAFCSALLAAVTILSGCQGFLEMVEAPFKGEKVTVSMTVPQEPPPAAKPLSESPDPVAQPVVVKNSTIDQRLLPTELPKQPESVLTTTHITAVQPVERPVRPLQEKGDTVLLSKTVSEDLTLKGTVLVRGTLILESQATIWIEPGTEIRFVPEKGSATPPGLVVQGRIVAKGSAEQPISFMPGHQNPLAGDWGGIILLNSSKNNQLEHCRFVGTRVAIDSYYSRLTGEQLNISKCQTGIALHDSDAVISQLETSRCDNAVTLSASEFELKHGNLSENRLGISAHNSYFSINSVRFINNSQEGLAINSGKFKVSNSRFEGNRTGVSVTAAEGELSGLLFKNNREDGAFLTGSNIKITSSLFAYSSGSGLVVLDSRGGVTGSIFESNQKFNLENRGSTTFSALLNWWGTVDENKIQKGIGLLPQHAGEMLVPFAPFLKGVPDIPLR